jgi:aminopeptidase YwaD
MRTMMGFAAGALMLAATPALAQESGDWVVLEQWVRAHEAFLASDALQGRGSATRDEAIAAAYVASEFLSYGLGHAPGMDSYLQKAKIISLEPGGPAQLTVNGTAVAAPTVFIAPGTPVGGTVRVAPSGDPDALPEGDVVLVDADGVDPVALYRAASAKQIGLLVLRESSATRATYDGLGGAPRLRSYLEGETPKSGTAFASLPAEAFDALAKQAGARIELSFPKLVKNEAVTTNAIGYLAGTDPSAGTLLFTAHLDHLGVQPDGTIMHGANDDASGTTAVLEIAHALAHGEAPKRSILFVCYGSEEMGLYGSKYFGEHPPVPLDQIVANIEFEMIGAQDPKLPADTLMMTGFERSNLGEAIKAHGGLVTADPYPDQHFFQRSDNYSLALKGIVAHTFSGWAVTPTYHKATDTYENIDFDFMTKAIQSLIAPMKWLANSDFEPEWKPGGKPVKE